MRKFNVTDFSLDQHMKPLPQPPERGAPPEQKKKDEEMFVPKPKGGARAKIEPKAEASSSSAKAEQNESKQTKKAKKSDKPFLTTAEEKQLRRLSLFFRGN